MHHGPRSSSPLINRSPNSHPPRFLLNPSTHIFEACSCSCIWHELGSLPNRWSDVVRQESACLSVVDSAADIREGSHRCSISLAAGHGHPNKSEQQDAEGTPRDIRVQGAPLPACNKVPNAPFSLELNPQKCIRHK